MIKIISTLGPSSYKIKILNSLKKLKVDIFRINLSHTNINQIEKKIIYLKKNKIKNICLDSEGAQIRTTNVKKSFFLKKNSVIKIFNNNKVSNSKNIYLTPKFNISDIKKDKIIDVGFENLKIKVNNFNINKSYINGKVIQSGIVESNKGCHINQKIKLNSLTHKDILALELSKKYKLKFFNISFVNNYKVILDAKKILGKKVKIISKIETRDGVNNLKQICKHSYAILIDRGDLSRFYPIEKIPLIQEYIVNIAKKNKTPVYVATNLLETMIKKNTPTRAESNDIYSTIKQGCKGLVLAAETAIGNFPIESIYFLKKCIKVFKTSKL